MTDAKDRPRPDQLAQQWQSLAERSRQHLLALYRSGRWRMYYSEEQMTAKMRDLVRAINAWDEVDRGGPRSSLPPRMPRSTDGRNNSVNS